MAFDTSGMTGFLFSFLSSAFFWLALGLIIVGTSVGALVIRKRRKLTIPFILLTDLGRKKAGVSFGKKNIAGYFKHHTTFFGLYDYGQEEVCKTKDGRQILNMSSEDYHEINGKMGLILQRSPEDPRILVPISKCQLTNETILNTIAPADYRGTVVDIIKKAEKETADRTAQIVQWATWGGIIIFGFIAILLITQMVQRGQTEAKDLILEAGRLGAENLKNICGGLQHAGDAIASTAP